MGFSDFLSRAREFADGRSKAADRLEKLKQARDELDTAPLPKSDLAALIDQWIDDQLAVFDRNVAAAVDRIEHRPAIDFARMQGGFPVLQTMDGTAGIDERLLVALLADAIKGRVHAVIDGMDWPDAGPPRKARPAARKRLDDEIAAAEQSLNEMDAIAREAGVRVQ